ncbi:MAG: non-ribosomal peptide synthetase [Flavisolibacter sp.]
MEPIIKEELLQGSEGPKNKTPLPSGEDRQWLEKFNDTAKNYNQDGNIVDLFREQLLRSPVATALMSEEEEINYQQLENRSNQLAHYLIDKGTGKDSLIPICTTRSIPMVVCMLAVLKAGAAYVPIDPDYPAESTRYKFDDTNSLLVLTDKRSRHKIPDKKSAVIIEVDGNWPEISNSSALAPDVIIQPRQLAYVIYTSGSTGRPKGVMIEHRALYVFIRWCMEEFSPESFDIAYALTSTCFDLSVFEIFFPLCIGKKIRIIESALEVEKYLYSDTRVLINTVPGVIDGLLKRKVSLASVTVINMAGEPVSSQLVQQLDTDRLEVRNLYGPTEDTTYSTVFRLKKNKPVLIGQPVSNTRIYILDENQKLLPPGETGEICIAGEGLARGYLNQEKLTTEKFVPDPFDQNHSSRMYRTGDIGRWLPDGNLEYLGRMDDQVKIRGYRIELAEIEYALEACTGVRKAIVSCLTDSSGNKRLVGFILPDGEFNKEKINSQLRDKLPEYMVPSLLVKQESFPLTTNGKIDRKIFARYVHVPDTEYSAPRNEVELALSDIWNALLVTKRTGIHDNFFELGGDSLLCMQLVSRARDAGFPLQPVDVFLYPTIEKLSELIDQRKNKEVPEAQKHRSIVAIQPEGELPPFFAIPGFWLFRKLAIHMGNKRPFYGFEPYNYINAADIAEGFLKELRSVAPAGPYFLCAFCEHYPIVFEMAQRLIREGEVAPLIVLIEAYAPSATFSKKSKHYISRKLKFYADEIRKLKPKDKMDFLKKETGRIVSFLYQKLTQRKSNQVDWPPYPGDLVLVRASITAPSFSDEPQMGWQNYVTGKIKTITIEGDHFGILNEPSVAILAEKLNEVLDGS